MSVPDIVWSLRSSLEPGLGCWLPTLALAGRVAVLAVPLYRFDLLEPRLKSPRDVLTLDPHTGEERGRLPCRDLGLPELGAGGWLAHPTLFQWTLHDWNTYYEALAALVQPFGEGQPLDARGRAAADVIRRSTDALAGPLGPFVRALGAELFEYLEGSARLRS